MKQKTSKIKSILMVFLQAFLIFLAIFSDISKVYPNRFAQPSSSGITINLLSFWQRVDALWGEYSFQTELILLFIIGSLFLFHKFISSKQKDFPIFCNVLAIIFALLFLFSESYFFTNSAVFILGDLFVLTVFFIRLIGYSILFSILIRLAFWGITTCTPSLRKDSEKPLGLIYIKVLAVLLLAYLPQLIAIFPGGYCNDIQSELMEYFGYLPMADPHPPLFTIIVGTCVLIGNKLFHNPTVGLFLYILIQYTFIATGLAYCVFFFYKRLRNKVLLILGTCFFALLPVFSYYASSVGKNAPYAVCLLWMSLSIYEINEIFEFFGHINDQGFPKSKIILLGLRFSLFSAIGSLICHNGIYVAIPMALGMIIMLLIKKPLRKLKLTLSPFLCFGIILFFLMTKLIYPAVGIEKGMDHLIYTNMLQHTCRLALSHPDELSEEDIAIISQVIEFDKIEEYYDPKTSDGIKPIVDLYASDEAVKKYINVWKKQLAKHPFVILDASFNVSYGFLSPVARNEEHDFSTWYYESEYPEFSFHLPTKLLGIRHLYEELLENYVSLPLIRLFENPGIYFWFYLFVVCFVLYHKRYDFIPFFIPGFMTSIFYLGIPAYYHHPRYAFPLIYSSVFYISLCIIAASSPVREDKDEAQN